ncbi:MAG: protoporphyrinogen oxidase [Verrucomicrobiales bacterium]|nr:protoporphyrinogen oxidase [Verrucomicrobiales bacterium]
MKKTIAVIGGGVTGLTAAFRLKQAGQEVTLFEAGERAGGVIRSVQRDEWLAECGPNTMLETSAAITRLVEDEDLGIAQLRRDASPLGGTRFILKKGKAVMLPGSPAGFLTTSLFSFSAKLGLAMEPFRSRLAADADEESLADFVRRRLGQEFLDYAINPFVAGVYAGDPENLSVKYGFPKLYALEQKYGSMIKGQILGARQRRKEGRVTKDRAKQLSFDGGLQVLTDALADYLAGALRLNTAVIRLAKTEDGRWLLESEKGMVADFFDEVVLALPAYRLAELKFDHAGNPAGDELALDSLKEIVYPPVSSVVLGFRRDQVQHSLAGFGTLNPEVEKVNTLGTLFTSSLFPERAPEGHVLLTTYVGGARSPDLALRPEDERVHLVMEDLRKIYGITGEPVFEHSFLYPRAIPQYEVGYGRFLETMQDFEAKHSGIHLAGHCRDGISLADSIVSGEKMVEKLSAK